MAVLRLVALLPPPVARTVFVWGTAEISLGAHLPGGYRRMLVICRSGMFNDDLSVVTPWPDPTMTIGFTRVRLCVGE